MNVYHALRFLSCLNGQKRNKNRCLEVHSVFLFIKAEINYCKMVQSPVKLIIHKFCFKSIFVILNFV